MLQFSTSLQMGVLHVPVWAWLTIVAFTAYVIIAWILSKNSLPRTYGSAWLLRNDRRVAQLVMSLSYIDNLKNHRRYLARKRRRFEAELLAIIREHNPDAYLDLIQIIFRELLLTAKRIATKRKESNSS